MLYAGRITSEKGVELLGRRAFCRLARASRVCGSCSPAADPSRSGCASASARRRHFLGWLEGDELAQAYANADVFLFPSRTDTFGQVILEAQASGLPVVAVAEGGPLSLIEQRVSGLLCARRCGRRSPQAVLELARLAAAARSASRAVASRPCASAPGSAPSQRLAARLPPRASAECAAAAHARSERLESRGLAMHVRSRDRHARTIAVALHGIEPATFERCALIRDWLDDHGVDRVTLLVIPARDLHPVGERSPAMVELAARASRAGDSIAQHGFQHVALRRRRRC